MNRVDEKKHYCINFQDVLNAAKRIDGIAHKTPVLTSTSLNLYKHPSSLSCNSTSSKECNRRKIFFKVEAMQRTGSFKFRGAMNATLSMMEDHEDRPRNSTDIDTTDIDADISNKNEEGVHLVTHSSGNHAAALALAAKIASESGHIKTNVRSTIVMPENAPIIKVNGVKGFGGNIIFVESTNEARESMADQIVKEQSAEFIHPSEDKRVIAGQGTVCLEFVEQVWYLEGFVDGDLDVVIIPVGGGGLAAGNIIALRGMLGDHVKIVLAEPEEMNDAKRSFESGKLLGHHPDNKLKSVADGLKTTLGPNTWPIVRDLADDIITVSEENILRATKLIWERLKVCIEPSAGVGVAVAYGQEFENKYKVEDGFEKVGIVLCGGNVDVLKIAALMQEKGL